MVGPVTPGRPQTLKQAKKAYRKSSAKPKLSAKELAIAERRTVLEGRAFRIKEKEARKKLNAKKREEKKEKERVTLMRMGKEIPQEGGIRVGPSQLDLVRFLPLAEKEAREHSELKEQSVRADEGSCQNMEKSAIDSQNTGDEAKDISIKNTSTELILPPPRRLPKESLIKTSVSPSAPASATKPSKVVLADLADLFVSNTQIQRELSPPPLKPETRHLSRSTTTAPLTLASTEQDDTVSFLAGISSQELDFALTQAEPINDIYQSEERLDSGYSTEYQTPMQKAALAPLLPLPTIDDLDLSSQDLDLSDLTQLPTLLCDTTRLPDVSTELDAKSSSSSFGDDFTDDDLTAVVEEVESSASNPEDSPAAADKMRSPA